MYMQPFYHTYKSIKLHSSTYPPSLLLRAVRMPVQAGENSPWRHQLTSLIPAMGMAETGGISLTLAVKDCIQSANKEVSTNALYKLLTFFSYSEMLLRQKNPLQVSYTITSFRSSVYPTEPTGGKMPVTQFVVNSLILQKYTKTFNYRLNLQHFLKCLPLSSAACQPNAAMRKEIISLMSYSSRKAGTYHLLLA